MKSLKDWMCDHLRVSNKALNHFIFVLIYGGVSALFNHDQWVLIPFVLSATWVLEIIGVYTIRKTLYSGWVVKVVNDNPDFYTVRVLSPLKDADLIHVGEIFFSIEEANVWLLEKGVKKWEVVK